MRSRSWRWSASRCRCSGSASSLAITSARRTRASSPTRYVPLTENPAQWLYHLILPWFVLAVLFIGFYGRVLRSNFLDSMNEDYVRTAKAKGLTPWQIRIKHARNTMIPILTLFASTSPRCSAAARS